MQNTVAQTEAANAGEMTAQASRTLVVKAAKKTNSMCG